VAELEHMVQERLWPPMPRGIHWMDVAVIDADQPIA
jgi:hypothetical protein